jgi:hypothetical protein
MKRSSVVALFLTVFSGLLILSATVFFLFQGRQTLLRQAGELRGERAGLSVTITSLEGNLVTVEVTREFLAQQMATREHQVIELQKKMAELTVEMDQHLGQAEEREREGRERAPLVHISSPEDGQIVTAGQAISLVVSATDSSGIIALHLTVDDESVATYAGNEEQPLVTLIESWSPPATGGEFTISAMATNVHGRTSRPVTVTVTTLDSDAGNVAMRSQVEANVVEIRGLQPITPVLATMLTSLELRQRLEADFEEDYSLEEAHQDAIIYNAFDFLERDFDLYNFWLDLYSEQIAGFYDTETAEFVVVGEAQEFGPSEQWTHAHEFVHALQDQHFDLGRITDDGIDPEAKLALRALAEGEATLVQLLYLDYFTEAEIAQIFAGMNDEGGAMLTSAPPVLRAALEFPYSAGFEFVTALYRQGGFIAIDAAWANLPLSTEHILHPERYLAGDDPIPVTLAPLTATLGAGWELLDQDVFGEFYLRQYLQQQLSDGEVDVAATGWGGDQYAVYWNESNEQLVMVLRLVWDTAADSDEFAAAYARYAAQLTGAAEQVVSGSGLCWSGQDVICLYHEGDETLVVRAPDLTTTSRIAAVQRVQPAQLAVAIAAEAR